MVVVVVVVVIVVVARRSPEIKPFLLLNFSAELFRLVH